MILFFLLPLLAVPVLSSLDKLSCHPGSFGIDLSDGSKAYVNGVEVSALFRRDNVRVYEYPNTDEANIRINDTIIIFKGNLSIGNSDTPPQRIDQVTYFHTKGTGKLKKYDHKTKLTECQISFVKNDSESLDFPREVEKEFERITHYCIGYQMCEKIGTIQPEDYVVSTSPDDLEEIFIYSKIPKIGQFPLDSTINETKKDIELQSFVNNIVDITLAELIIKLKEKHDERIKIPDINKLFSFGSGFFETSGNFNATDGHFSDLTTLKRTNDAVFERQGNKYAAASCGFGLSTARIEYNHYKIKYGLIKVSGKMSADVNGIAIDSKVSVDYNPNPCKTELEYFKISEFGKVKVKVTGLGPLNSLASSLVNWITKKWHTDIAALIESKVTGILKKQIQKFNCEKYRP